MKDLKIKILNSNKEKEKYIDEVWDVLTEGYRKVQGGLHFKSKYELIISTEFWKVICYKGKVIATTVYKAKKGLKLVALSVGNFFRDIAISELKKVIKRDLKYCWMELSEAAEKFVMKLGGEKYIFPSAMVARVLGKEVELIDDGIHYIRLIMGTKKEKVLLGTIKL